MVRLIRWLALLLGVFMLMARPALAQSVLKKLREAGAVAVGIGITESGKAALATYAPDARLAKRAEDLPRVFGELFKEHLAQL